MVSSRVVPADIDAQDVHFVICGVPENRADRSTKVAAGKRNIRVRRELLQFHVHQDVVVTLQRVIRAFWSGLKHHATASARNRGVAYRIGYLDDSLIKNENAFDGVAAYAG